MSDIENIIRKLGGIVTDTNIEYLMDRFNEIGMGRDEMWEEFLVKESNADLFMSQIRCSKCNSRIIVLKSNKGTRVNYSGRG